jgi:hypothetical protein
VRVIPLSDPVYNATGELDINAINRKYLQTNVIKRRMLKQMRRAQMTTTERYYNEFVQHEGVLTEAQTNLKDALQIVKESTERGESMVTFSELMDFINDRIHTTIFKALHKVNLAAERLDETHLDLNDIWSDLRSRLLDLAVEAKLGMESISSDAIQEAKAISIGGHTAQDLKLKVSQVAREESSPLTTVLAMIAGIEFVGYVIFFCVKRKQTHNFKKID